MTDRELVESYGYKVVTRDEFDDAIDVPDGLREGRGSRTSKFAGHWVIYDPDGDEEDWFLTSDDLGQILSETIDRLNLVRPSDITASHDMLSALRAVQARIKGVFDDPDLMEFGVLSPDVNQDVLDIIAPALAKATA